MNVYRLLTAFCFTLLIECNGRRMVKNKEYSGIKKENSLKISGNILGSKNNLSYIDHKRLDKAINIDKNYQEVLKTRRGLPDAGSNAKKNEKKKLRRPVCLPEKNKGFKTGLNILAKCNNVNCNLYNKIQWINFGYIFIGIGKLVTDIKCGSCQKNIKRQKAFDLYLGFSNCKFSYNGRSHELGAISGTDETLGNKVIDFSLTPLIFLNIKALPLDSPGN